MNRGPRNTLIPFWMPALAVLLSASGVAAESIEVESVLLTPVQEVEVPAREAGTLDCVAVREGTVVTQGELAAA